MQTNADTVEGARAETDASRASAAPPQAVAWRLGLALLATAAVMWQAQRGAFVYDDLWLVAQNPTIRGFGRALRSLASPYWDFVDSASSDRIAFWRPLTTLALGAGYAIGGGAAYAFHLVSLAVHLAGVAAAFMLARRLTKNADIAFWTALLFGIHPVQVEPVAWISAINDPLNGVCCLLALDAFVRWRERGSPGVPIGACVWFLLALSAKENAVALLPLTLALDVGRVPTRDAGAQANTRPFWRAYAPLVASLAIYWVARAAVFGDPMAGFDRVMIGLELSGGRELSLRLELLGGFLGLLAFPYELNLMRDLRPEIPLGDPTLWIAIACIAIWLAAVVYCARRKLRPQLGALLMLVAGVVPALLRIEVIGRFPLSERYLYVPVFGIALFLALTVHRLLPKLPATLALALVAGAAAWRSYTRIPFWESERTVFAISAEQNPNSPYVYWGLGRVLLDEYRATGDTAMLDGSLIAFQHSQDLGRKRDDGTRDESVLVTDEDRLQANLGYAWYHFFGALANHAECTFEEAEGIFRQVLVYRPTSFEAMAGLGVVLMQQGKLDEAEQSLRDALALNPKHFEAWYYLGQLEAKRGDDAASAEAFTKAAELQPEDRETLTWLGGALGDAGRTDEARLVLARAAELYPDDPEVMLRLGVVAAQSNDEANALYWFDRALKVDPEFGPAHLQRAKILLARGQPDLAVASLDRACKLMPNDFEAHYNLGVLLLSAGNAQEALPFLERALELQKDGPHAQKLREEIARLKAK